MIVEAPKECFVFVSKVTRHKLLFIDPEILNMGVIRSVAMTGTSYRATRTHTPEDRKPE